MSILSPSVRETVTCTIYDLSTGSQNCQSVTQIWTWISLSFGILCVQLFLTLCDNGLWPAGSSVYGIFQARILEQFVIPHPGDLPDPGIKLVSLVSPALAGSFFTTAPPGKHLTCPLIVNEHFMELTTGHPQDKICH